MTVTRWSSKDWYHTLVAIEGMVRRLPCRGLHEDDAKAWFELLEYISREREECAFRATRAAVASDRKARYVEEASRDAL